VKKSLTDVTRGLVYQIQGQALCASGAKTVKWFRFISTA
jgi:hypothetical protein